MPRASRKKSESGVYHIMLRGINQQVIFEENEDYEKFIDVLKKYKIVCGYKLFAYCLMSNHIHIIIKEENENIDQIIKRIAGSYVYWYNSKYYRRGHLFQDRFRSEPIEDNNYLFAAIRYVHQNPLKAEIIDKLGEYKYCSYSDYVNEYSELIDKDFVFQTVSKDAFINNLAFGTILELYDFYQEEAYPANSDDLVIKAPKDSTAIAYAQRFGIKCEELV